jgi:hypothetical protein
VQRHDFEPGKLIAGLVLLSAGIIYALDATGRWNVPAWALLPLLTGGLSLAGLTGALTYAARRRSARSAAADRGGTTARDRSAA